MVGPISRGKEDSLKKLGVSSAMRRQMEESALRISIERQCLAHSPFYRVCNEEVESVKHILQTSPMARNVWAVARGRFISELQTWRMIFINYFNIDMGM